MPRFRDWQPGYSSELLSSWPFSWVLSLFPSLVLSRCLLVPIIWQLLKETGPPCPWSANPLYSFCVLLPGHEPHLWRFLRLFAHRGGSSESAAPMSLGNQWVVSSLQTLDRESSECLQSWEPGCSLLAVISEVGLSWCQLKVTILVRRLC